jgi:hypothetical protein
MGREMEFCVDFGDGIVIARVRYDIRLEEIAEGVEIVGGFKGNRGKDDRFGEGFAVIGEILEKATSNN